MIEKHSIAHQHTCDGARGSGGGCLQWRLAGLGRRGGGGQAGQVLRRERTGAGCSGLAVGQVLLQGRVVRVGGARGLLERSSCARPPAASRCPAPAAPAPRRWARWPPSPSARPWSCGRRARSGCAAAAARGGGIGGGSGERRRRRSWRSWRRLLNRLRHAQPDQPRGAARKRDSQAACPQQTFSAVLVALARLQPRSGMMRVTADADCRGEKGDGVARVQLRRRPSLTAGR